MGESTPLNPRVVLLSTVGIHYGAQVLQAAQQQGLNIVAVIAETTARRPRWRRFLWYAKRRRLWAGLFRSCEVIVDSLRRFLRGEKRTPVEQAASQYGIAFETVKNMNDPECHALIARYQPALALLGGTRILSLPTVRQFPAGVINTHVGLLPEYRGNYPNRWALLNGGRCGITAYLLDEGLDTGPILARVVTPRQAGETVLAMERRLRARAAEFTAVTARQYLHGEISPLTQARTAGDRTYRILPARKALKLHLQIWAENHGFLTRTLPADPADFEKVSCPLCGADDAKILRRGTSLAQIVRCQHDGLSYLNPRPRPELIDEQRRKFVGADHLEAYGAFRQPMLRREARAVRKRKAGGSLLDIGCATGTFFNFFPQDSWQLFGLDTSSFAAEIARQNGGAEVFCGTLKEAQYRSQSFDVVTVLDTLYYNPSPIEELREIRRVLKDDGLLVIEIPGSSYRLFRDQGPVSLILNGVWKRDLTDSQHLFFFSPRTIKLLLEKAGFQIIDVIPEQASTSLGPLGTAVNYLHFGSARFIFKLTGFSIAGKEMYFAAKKPVRD